MTEKFKTFEQPKFIPAKIVSQEPMADEIWTQDQVREMVAKQEAGRVSQIADAKRLALEKALNPAFYTKESLELILGAEELTSFNGFFSEIEALQGDLSA